VNVPQKLNTHGVGYLGLASGGVSVISAVYALYKLLSDAKYDTSLYYALIAARQHTASHDDVFVIMQLVAACFAIFGGLIIGLVLSYIGRPRTIPTEHPSLASTPGS
jgi:hypothetical protein